MMHKRFFSFRLFPLAFLSLSLLVMTLSGCEDDDDTRTGTWEVKLYADSAKVMTIEGITRDFNIPDRGINYDPTHVIVYRGSDGMHYIAPFQNGVGEISVEGDGLDYTIQVTVLTEAIDVMGWRFMEVESLIDCDDDIRQALLADMDARNAFSDIVPGEDGSYMTIDWDNWFQVWMVTPDAPVKELRVFYSTDGKPYYRWQYDGGVTKMTFELLDRYWTQREMPNLWAFAKKGVFHCDMTDYFQAQYGAGRVRQARLDYFVYSISPNYDPWLRP